MWAPQCIWSNTSPTNPGFLHNSKKKRNSKRICIWTARLNCSHLVRKNFGENLGTKFVPIALSSPFLLVHVLVSAVSLESRKGIEAENLRVISVFSFLLVLEKRDSTLIDWEMSTFVGVLVSDPWLQSQFTQVELRSLKSKVNSCQPLVSHLSWWCC